MSGSITFAIAFACGATSAFSPVNPYTWLRRSITPPTVAADTRVPRNFQDSCFLGVEPSQYPTLRSVTKPPAIERAVHTTPPITMDAAMPDVPLSPTATKMADAMIRVMRVMPDTGLEPTIAIALAATVVNRNAINVTTIHATRACQNVLMTPAQKNTNTAMSAMAMKNTICFMDMSVCQRIVFFPSVPPLNSREASPTASRMMPQDFTIPMIPAIAIPPMPMRRA